MAEIVGEPFGDDKVARLRRLGSNVIKVRRSNPAGKDEPLCDAGGETAELSLEVETQPKVPDTSDLAGPDIV